MYGIQNFPNPALPCCSNGHPKARDSPSRYIAGYFQKPHNSTFTLHSFGVTSSAKSRSQSEHLQSTSGLGALLRVNLNCSAMTLTFNHQSIPPISSLSLKPIVLPEYVLLAITTVPTFLSGYSVSIETKAMPLPP